MLAPPFMITMGNSVPPPSIRWRFVSWGHGYGPNNSSSHRNDSTRAAHGHTVPPRILFTPQIKHPHDDVFKPTLLVDVAGIHRPSEMVHPFCIETNALPPEVHRSAATRLRGSGSVPVPLVIDSNIGACLCTFPSGIAFDRYSRRTHNLILRQVQRHIVGGELPVELTRRKEGMVLPSGAVVHHHARIPLREIVPPVKPSLSPGNGAEAGVPPHCDFDTVARRQRQRQLQPYDGRVWCVGILRGHGDAVHGAARDPLKGVVRLTQIVESTPALYAVAISPPRPRSKGIQVEMQVEPRRACRETD